MCKQHPQNCGQACHTSIFTRLACRMFIIPWSGMGRNATGAIFINQKFIPESPVVDGKTLDVETCWYSNMGWANVISLNSFHVIVLGDPKLGWLATEHYQCVCGRVIFLESTKRRGQTLWLDWSRRDLPSGILTWQLCHSYRTSPFLISKSSIKCPPFVAVLVYLRLIQNLWIVQWNRSHHLLGFIKKIVFSHLDWDVFQEPLLKATITAFFPSGSSACAAAGRWLLAMMLSSCKAFRQRVPGWVSCYWLSWDLSHLPSTK